MKKSFIKIKLPLIIYLFFLMFLPPIIKDINVLLILYIVSFLIILIKYRSRLKDFFSSKVIRKSFFIFFIYIIWCILVIVFNAFFYKEFFMYSYLINFYSIFLVVPCIFTCVMFVIFYCDENKIEFNELIKYIIIAGLIQSFIAISALLFPEVKTLLIKIMYYTTGDNLYLHQYNTERRFFGFANNMLDSFGFGTGVLAVLPLFYSVNNSKKWLLTVPFLVAVPLLNSRTGLVIFALGFFIWLIYILRQKKFKNYFSILISIVILTILLVLLVKVFNFQTINWIIRDSLSFFTNSFGTADILFGKGFWVLPEKIFNIIVGKGYIIASYGGMKDVIGLSSDVGYINEIWKSGLIGLGLLFILLSYLSIKLYKNCNKYFKYFVIFLFFSILVANIKFSVLSCNLGLTIFLILFVYAFNNKKQISDEEELISVIIPIYKVEKYLDRCLNSVVKQTYKNIQIILVNDGSPDNSEEICLKYSKKDKRIKYVKQENAGLSAARNRGVKESNGEYYIFIDSDDYVNIHFVEELYNTLKSNDADIAVCDYKYVYDTEDDVNIKVLEKRYVSVFENNNKFYKLYGNNSIQATVAWNKIYKKYIFEKIEYPVGKLHEDEAIICKVFDLAKKVAYTDCEYYYYFQRSDSIMGSYNFRRCDILYGLNEKLMFFKKNKMKRLYYYALYDYFYQLLYQYTMIKLNYVDKKSKLKEIIKEIDKYKYEVFFNLYIDPIKRVKIFIKFFMVRRDF